MFALCLRIGGARKYLRVLHPLVGLSPLLHCDVPLFFKEENTTLGKI